MLRPTPNPLCWRVLEPLLDEAPAGINGADWEAAVVEPLRSFLQRPGKEFRATLLVHAWHLAGGQGNPPDALPAAVELIHAASLVLDDIEDDSTCRRGRPCLHREFGLPLALNAGTALLLIPLQLLGALPLEPAQLAALQRRAVDGMLGCHRGQALDLSLRIDSCSPAKAIRSAETIASLKTGRLLRLAAELGAIGAGADEPTIAALGDLGDALGCALQMLNDWADLTCGTDPDKRWEDLLARRVTWPWAWAAERVDEEVWRSLIADCVALAGCPNRAERLAERLQLALGTDRPYEARLSAALGCAKRALGNHPALAALRADLDRLVASYVG